MTKNIPPEIKTFLDQLLEDARYVNLTPALKDQMVLDLYTRLDNKLIAAAFESMPPEHVDAFAALIDKKASGEKLNSFLAENVPHIKEIFANAMIDFRNSYIGAGAPSA